MTRENLNSSTGLEKPSSDAAAVGSNAALLGNNCSTNCDLKCVIPPWRLKVKNPKKKNVCIQCPGNPPSYNAPHREALAQVHTGHSETQKIESDLARPAAERLRQQRNTLKQLERIY